MIVSEHIELLHFLTGAKSKRDLLPVATPFTITRRRSADRRSKAYSNRKSITISRYSVQKESGVACRDLFRKNGQEIRIKTLPQLPSPSPLWNGEMPVTLGGHLQCQNIRSIVAKNLLTGAFSEVRTIRSRKPGAF
jgi:hypothetical protein